VSIANKSLRYFEFRLYVIIFEIFEADLVPKTGTKLSAYKIRILAAWNVRDFLSIILDCDTFNFLQTGLRPLVGGKAALPPFADRIEHRIGVVVILELYK